MLLIWLKTEIFRVFAVGRATLLINNFVDIIYCENVYALENVSEKRKIIKRNQ